MSLILASTSPRRRELLAQIGMKFAVHPVDIDETPLGNESGEAFVVRMAKEKAQAAAAQHTHNQDIILAADTIGLANGKILGKPRDLSHAKEMLQLLSGHQHTIITSIALIRNNRLLCQSVSTQVWFRDITEQEIEDYWQTGEPQDKAGAYAIQGIGGKFVSRIDGSYSAVVGLPLMETEQLIKQLQQE